MFKKDKVLHIIASNKKTNNSLHLYYSILDIDIADRWANLIDINNSRLNTVKSNFRKILDDEGITEAFIEFRDNINYINEHYDRVLTDIVDIEFLRTNQYILNDLHEEFEIYGDRLENLVQIGYFSNPMSFTEYYNPIWPGSENTNDKILHEAFLRLNEQIHNFETLYRTWDSKDTALCTCLWDFIPAGLHEDLKPEDYFLFCPSHKWGWAYLGYNTLGKHWSSTCHDDDVAVVKRNQVRPQARFAAETYMNFSLNDQGHFPQIKFYSWWLKNDFSNLIDTENMRLKDLAFGHIPVAMLSSYRINDLPLVQVNSNAMTLNDKKIWNKEIWSKYDHVESAIIE